jgi:hypothetical protein
MPLPRHVSSADPLPTDFDVSDHFDVSTYGQIWMSTQGSTILGSDSGERLHHIGCRKTSEEERHGKRGTVRGRLSLAVVMVAALVLAVGMPGQRRH